METSRSFSIFAQKTWQVSFHGERGSTFKSKMIYIIRTICHMNWTKIIKSVKDQSANFGIVVDGTQDTHGKEQQSISVRYVTDSSKTIEHLLGLYSTSSQHLFN